jgi:NodT family efflux transporter outer membrane factor (OMF) lipoprotein
MFFKIWLSFSRDPKSKTNGSCFVISLSLIAMYLLQSCAPFKPELRADLADGLPQSYSLFTGQADLSQPWWRSFAAPELAILINAAFANNFSLKEAWARLMQTKALAKKAGAAFFPEIAAEADALSGRQRSSDRVDPTIGFQDFSLGLVSSYELDLWGRIRSEQEAAAAQVNASQEDLYAARMTLSAEVAQRWINIISQELQKRLLEKQLETNRIFLELIELRFRKSMVSALDVYQQRQVVESIEAEIPLVEAQKKLFEHQLALLMGKPPAAPLPIAVKKLPQPNALPAAGLPADLLANRPDIRSAGALLKAADWQVAAARANRLPAISLRAGATYGEGDLDILFDNWLLRLAASLSAPLFDGGRRTAELQRSQAAADENLWTYRRTVLTAFKEVEDALVSETKQRAHIDALKKVYATASKGLEEAISRYRNGLSDYLPVLTQLITVQNLERDLIRQETVLLLYRVALHRALGGAWMRNYDPATRNVSNS